MDLKDTILEGAEQISSLQELHNTIQVITIRGWVAFFFVFLFSSFTIFWAFAGNLPISVDGKCILVEEFSGSLKVYAFLPLYSGEQVREGMRVNVSLDSIDSSQFGTIEGIVEKVSSYPVSMEDRVLKKIPSESLKEYFLKGSIPKILVTISLPKDLKTKSGYKWTSKKKPIEPIPIGSVGEAQVILRTIRPISYVIPEV